jgi:PIN domain nuclease of toxin-antitoxin system
VILLDTRTVLWALSRPDRLGGRAQRLVAQADVRYISVLTHMELEIKRSQIDLRMPVDLVSAAADAGFTALPLEDRHARAMNQFPQLERHDPFDRMLVAQADVDRLTLLTADRVLLALDQPWIVDATQ